MKAFARIFKYEGLLLTGIALLVLFLATDMFVRFWYLLLAGPVLLAAGFLMDLGSVGATLRRRTAKYGVNAAVFTALVLGIVVFANIVAQGRDKTWDGTSAKVNTLADQTVKILGDLKSPVRVKAFFNTGEGREYETLLERFKNAAPSGLFEFQMVDPDQHPEILQQYDVSRRGAIVVEYEAQKNIIVEQTESALAQSMLKVTQTKGGPICFVTGHGEATIGDNEETGASLVRKLLENENHDVKEIVLAGRAVPEECSALIIAGPDRALAEVEVETVKAWVAKGASLLFLAEPSVVTGLEAWLSEAGVGFDDNVVVEPMFNPFFGSQLGVSPVVQDYGHHEITKDMKQPTIFNMARSLTADYGREGALVSPILQTTDQSWGEKDVKKLLEEQAVEKSDEDKAGPLVLGVAVEMRAKSEAPPKDVDEPDDDAPPAGKTPAGRVVVIGDSSFLRNGLVSQLYNTDFALNVVAWLAGKEETISIRPNRFEASPIFLTAEDRAKVFFVSVIAVPMLVSMLGIGLLIARGRRSGV